MYVYPRPFTEKPKKSDIEAINRDLYLNYSNNYYDWNIEEIAYLFGNGHTICPVELSESRRIKSNWSSQQLFLLDFDEYDVKSCKEISKSINIWPSFGYYTFSHTEQKPKFPIGVLVRS